VCIQANACFLVPTRVHNPNGISIGLAIFAQLTAVSLGMHVHILSPKKLPLRLVRSGPPSNTWFLGSTQILSPNGISIGSAVFTQLTAERPYTLQWTPFSPSKLPIPMGDLGPSFKWFLGPTRVLNPNYFSIGSAVYAGLITVTDRQTDRPRYAVCNNRPHLHTQYCDAAQ